METKIIYQKLNWLLIDLFESERRYFNASEDIQEAELKRFLHHESVNRNRYAHKIEEKILQAGIEPQKYLSKKGNLHRNGLEIKKALTNCKWREHLAACIIQDERCLKRYQELLQIKNFPKDVQLMLHKQRTDILSSLDQAIIYKRRKKLPPTKPDPKVIPLKAI